MHLPSLTFPSAPLRLPLLLHPPPTAGPTQLLSHHLSLGFPASSLHFHPAVLKALTDTELPAFTPLHPCPPVFSPIPTTSSWATHPQGHIQTDFMPQRSETPASSDPVTTSNLPQAPGLPSSDVGETQAPSFMSVCLFLAFHALPALPISSTRWIT